MATGEFHYRCLALDMVSSLSRPGQELGVCNHDSLAPAISPRLSMPGIHSYYFKCLTPAVSLSLNGPGPGPGIGVSKPLGVPVS